jgi:hypothetical protein
MSGDRPSSAHLRNHASRVRQLASEATTARAKEYLLAQARESEGLIAGFEMTSPKPGEHESADEGRGGGERC